MTDHANVSLENPLSGSISFRDPKFDDTTEVIRIDQQGFHYRGQFIEDAGEAHRLFVEFLYQNKTRNESD